MDELQTNEVSMKPKRVYYDTESEVFTDKSGNKVELEGRWIGCISPNCDTDYEVFYTKNHKALFFDHDSPESLTMDEVLNYWPQYTKEIITDFYKLLKNSK